MSQKREPAMQGSKRTRRGQVKHRVEILPAENGVVRNRIYVSARLWLSLLYFRLLLSFYGADIVVPPDLANSDGNSVGSFQFNGQRIQQVYGSSFFNSVSALELSQIRLRVDPNAQPFSSTSDLEVRLFTTTDSPDTLRATWFTPNGATVVALPRTQLAWSGNPGLSFDAVIPLPNHFVYEPANGNLVVDFLVYDRGLNPTGFDVVDRSLDGIGIVGGVITSASAQFNSAGFVTEFEYSVVPEPKAVLLFLMGFILVRTWRRRHVAT